MKFQGPNCAACFRVAWGHILENCDAVHLNRNSTKRFVFSVEQILISLLLVYEFIGPKRHNFIGVTIEGPQIFSVRHNVDLCVPIRPAWFDIAFFSYPATL